MKRRVFSAVAFALVPLLLGACGTESTTSVVAQQEQATPEVSTSQPAPDRCDRYAANTLQVIAEFVPLENMRGFNDPLILPRHELTPEQEQDRNVERQLSAATRGQFGPRGLVYGYSINGEELEYFSEWPIGAKDTYGSFLDDGGVLVTSVESAYESGLAGALLHPADGQVGRSVDVARFLPVRIGPFDGVVNQADPVNGEGVRPHLVTWFDGRRDFTVHAVVEDPATIVNWAVGIACSASWKS